MVNRMTFPNDTSRYCYLCANSTKIQSNYCEEHGQICQSVFNGKACGKPASFGCGVCKDHHKQTCDEIDVVMQWVDQQCWAGEWEEINNKMKELDTTTMEPSICVSWLSMTKCVSKHLPYRVEFFAKCKNRLIEATRSRIHPDVLSLHKVEDRADRVLRNLE